MRITDRIAKDIEDALTRVPDGEEVHYDVMMLPRPDPSGGGVMMTCGIVMEIPGLELGGPRIGTIAQLGSLQVSPEQIDQTVQQVVTALRAQKAEMVQAATAEMNGHGDADPQRLLDAIKNAPKL